MFTPDVLHKEVLNSVSGNDLTRLADKSVYSVYACVLIIGMHHTDAAECKYAFIIRRENIEDLLEKKTKIYPSL